MLTLANDINNTNDSVYNTEVIRYKTIETKCSFCIWHENINNVRFFQQKWITFIRIIFEKKATTCKLTYNLCLVNMLECARLLVVKTKFYLNYVSKNRSINIVCLLLWQQQYKVCIYIVVTLCHEYQFHLPEKIGQRKHGYK